MVSADEILSGQTLSDHQLQSRLSEAVRLPSQHRTVADWLFDVHADDYRSAPATIPPSGFENALAIVSESQSIPSDTSSLAVSQQASPQDGHEKRNKTFVVFIPNEEIDGITFGHTFHIGVPIKHTLFPVRDVLRSTFAMVGKFVFDRAQSELLIYLKLFTASNAVLTHIRYIDFGKEVSMFSLPLQDYDYYNIPSRCIGLTVYKQRKIASLSSSHPASGSRAMRTSADDLSQNVSENVDIMCGRHPGPAIYSSGVWGDDEVTQLDTHLLDRIESAESKLSCEYSFKYEDLRDDWDSLEKSSEMAVSRSGSIALLPFQKGLPPGATLNSDYVETCTTALSCFLIGKFRSSLKRFMGRSSLGQREAPVEVHMVTETKEVTVHERKMLQTFAARSYYADTLSVTTDMPLIAKPDDLTEGSSQKKCSENVQYGGNETQRVLRG